MISIFADSEKALFSLPRAPESRMQQLRILEPPFPPCPPPAPPPAGEFRACFQIPFRKSRAFPPFSICTRAGAAGAVAERFSAARSSSDCCGSGGGRRGAAGGGGKVVDLATLGNLCVDIVLGVPQLPPEPKDERRAYMEGLAASRPDKKYWEAGGNCNLAIAGARLGLKCLTLGYVGDEVYGNFLLDVLQEEGIDWVGINEDVEAAAGAAYETLRCWVLVDPMQRHGFCSRADFSDNPAFSWMINLSEEAKTAISQSKVLFCNGYVFDELSPGLISSAVEYAINVGTAVFFDPGPRGKTLRCGTLEEQKALHLCLTMCDVLLLTSDEAHSLTGIDNPILAGQELIRKGMRTKWVIIKMGAKGSMLITSSTISCAPAFKVKVVDTVGCGDSYVAAVAYGFLHKVPTINTLLLANAVGAATATGSGAGRNVAKLEKVLELLNNASVNDDDRTWYDIVSDNVDAEDIIMLSRAAVNGTNNRVSHVSVQSATIEILHKFELDCETNMVQI